MSLKNFVDLTTVVYAEWLNRVDVLLDTVFNSANSKATARTALEVYSTTEVDTAVSTLPSDLLNTADVAKNDALVGGKRTDTGAVAFTLHEYHENRWINVKTDFGAVGDGVTDDTAAIQAAIDAAEANSGSTIIFPSGTYLISSGLAINDSSVRLIGAGCSFMTNSAPYNQEYATRLIADSGFPANTPMLAITSVAGAAHPIHSDQVIGIQLDCQSNADSGIEIISTRGTRLQDVSVFDPLEVGIGIYVISPSGWTGSNRATKQFVFDNVLVRCDTTTTARGIVIDGASDGINVNFGTIRDVYVQHANGVGIDIYDSDGIHFERIVTWTAGSGKGVVFNGSSTAGKGSARGHFGINFQCTVGGIIFKSGTIQNAIGSVILFYNSGNATPEPIFETGARNFVSRDYGFDITHDNGPVVSTWHTNTVTAGSFPGIFQADGTNSAGDRTTFAQMKVRVTDGTDGSEDGQWDIMTVVAGTLARRGYIASGLVLGTPTAGDLGPGSGDFSGVVRSDAGFRFPVFSAANIADITNAVNTANKVQGLAVWDLTNRRIMVADGSAAGANWYVSDGSVSVTPV